MGKRARVLSSGVSTILALAVMASLAAMPASAKTCYKNIVPPGRSGASQYVEVVPTTCGGATPPSTGTRGSGGAGGSIARLGHGAAGVRNLSHMGPQGQAAAALAAATAPALAGAPIPERSASSADTPSGQAAASSANGASTVGTGKIVALPANNGSTGGALGEALTGGGSDGLGLLLPAMMGLLLALAIITAIIRARRGNGRSPA